MNRKEELNKSYEVEDARFRRVMKYAGGKVFNLTRVERISRIAHVVLKRRGAIENALIHTSIPPR